MDPLIVAQTLNFAYAVISLLLVVLGLAVTLGWLGVMNLAHGEFVMLGAYVAVVTERMGWPFWAAIPLTILFCIVLGIVVERLLIRPLYSRPFDLLLATWGLSILIRKIVEAAFGGGYISLTVPVKGSLDILGASYPTYRILIMAFTVALLAMLLAWYFRSSAAARVKAMVGNPMLAQAVGIDTNALARNTFVVGTCLAGLAGVIIAPVTSVNPFLGLDYVINAFFVIIVGGLGSVLGLFAGSGIIGGLDSFVSAILDRTSAFFLVLLIAIFFLWLRPRGLFARN